MGWSILAVIVLVFGVAAYVEFRRVPRVQDWAIRHGFSVMTSPDAQLQSGISADVAAFGTAGGWGFGLVLTREMTPVHLRVCECRMRLNRGTAWHIVCSVSTDEALDETALRAGLPKSLAGREAVVGKQGVVWRRRGLLWPKRLDEAYAEAEQVREAVLAASRR